MAGKVESRAMSAEQGQEQQQIPLGTLAVLVGVLVSIHAVFAALVLRCSPLQQSSLSLLLFTLAVLGLLFGGGYCWIFARWQHSRQAQQQSEQLYRSFVEQTTEGVVLVEAGTLQVIEANAAARNLLALGQGRLCLADAVRLEQAPLAEVLAGIPPDEHRRLGEIEQPLPDGKVVQLELTASTLCHRKRTIHSLLVRDVSESRKAEKEIRFHAYHDALTRLPNRLLFEDRLRVALAQAQREQENLAIIFLDLDGLKEVNDSYGHDTGDLLLVEAARRLQTKVRAGDTVARVGGDEFLVLLPAISYPEDTIDLCNRLLQELRAPMLLNGREVSVSASMGVTLFPEDGTDVRDLVHKADMAMYHAKEQGKDCWQLYNPEMREHLRSLAEMRLRLVQALEQDELRLQYQPQVDARTGRVVAVEALLRWMRPGEGLLLPAVFLAAAEQSGVIKGIGEWVLRTGCGHLRSWIDQGLAPPRLAINLSRRQFLQATLPTQIQRALEDSKIPPTLLELEISEETAMHEPAATLRILGTLRELGISVALDDFGTGFSSLAYLRRFPLQRAKIDCSFVGRLPESPDDRAVVVLLLGLAHGLGLEAVAEGVGSLEAQAFLVANGCDLLQGHAVSRPVPSEEIGCILAKNKEKWRAEGRAEGRLQEQGA
ncbi:MAG: EAL domain-containing protein [Deltaproteobacteria bacterium]|nr:EAL domain-containing protein [Deltaproteobacteria bacterium]